MSIDMVHVFDSPCFSNCLMLTVTVEVYMGYVNSLVGSVVFSMLHSHLPPQIHL